LSGETKIGIAEAPPYLRHNSADPPDVGGGEDPFGVLGGSEADLDPGCPIPLDWARLSYLSQ
jgi:hypothetical protein